VPLEGKSTVNGASVWDKEGSDAAPSGRADLRVVGDASGESSATVRSTNSSIDRE
jgi:hypothetical protein